VEEMKIAVKFEDSDYLTIKCYEFASVDGFILTYDEDGSVIGMFNTSFMQYVKVLER
jgi:hypothetical protein